MGGFDVARRRIPAHACAATRERAGGSRHGVAGLNGLEAITSRFWGLIAMCPGWLADCCPCVCACMSESFVSFVCSARSRTPCSQCLCIPGWRGAAAAASVATLSFSLHVGLGGGCDNDFPYPFPGFFFVTLG